MNLKKLLNLQKIFMLKKLNKYKFLILTIFLIIPTFWNMVPKGIYSMQDFHLFRLFEFDKCIKSFQIPCRWAPDAGLGFGEPLFNFYGQFSYVFGEMFHLAGGSFINSIKFSFILSLVGSAIAMYFLAKSLWKNEYSSVLSSLLYLYAPYRAVDVWVRGALPESFSFILFPLIILAVEKKNLFFFSLLTFILVITHNLSFVMFLPLLLIWIIYRKWFKGFIGFVIAGLLSAFYTLPVIFESKFVNLGSTTTGYFDFRAHFITLKQIFLDLSWGYGGSTWGSGDGLNLSVGLAQWIIPVVTLILLFLAKKIKGNKEFLLLLVFGFIYLLLTHNKTAFMWEALTFMKYIQFPWRFLGIAVFCFALASGVLFNVIKNKFFIGLVFILLTVYSLSFTVNYFRPDIWYPVSDNYFLEGSEWDRQRTASIGDFWPNFGHKIPDTPSDGTYINYFPGWVGADPKDGLIPSGNVEFKDTPIRKLGNIVSLISLLGIIIWRKKLT